MSILTNFLKLLKPEPNDYVDVEKHISENYDKIDNKIEELDGYINKKTTQTSTIAELQSRKNLKVGDIVEVLGYYTAGDGAGHKRIIANEDDGSGVQLSNKLWANIVHNGEVNVSWFGAKGDFNKISETQYSGTSIVQYLQKAIDTKSVKIINGNKRNYFISKSDNSIILKSDIEIRNFNFYIEPKKFTPPEELFKTQIFTLGKDEKNIKFKNIQAFSYPCRIFTNEEIKNFNTNKFMKQTGWATKQFGGVAFLITKYNIENLKLNNFYSNGLDYIIKTGLLNYCEFNNVISINTIMPFYANGIKNSSFKNIKIDRSNGRSQTYHTFYINGDVDNILFSNINVIGCVGMEIKISGESVENAINIIIENYHFRVLNALKNDTTIKEFKDDFPSNYLYGANKIGLLSLLEYQTAKNIFIKDSVATNDEPMIIAPTLVYSSSTNTEIDVVNCKNFNLSDADTNKNRIFHLKANNCNFLDKIVYSDTADTGKRKTIFEISNSTFKIIPFYKTEKTESLISEYGKTSIDFKFKNCDFYLTTSDSIERTNAFYNFAYNNQDVFVIFENCNINLDFKNAIVMRFGAHNTNNIKHSVIFKDCHFNYKFYIEQYKQGNYTGVSQLNGAILINCKDNFGFTLNCNGKMKKDSDLPYFLEITNHKKADSMMFFYTYNGVYSFGENGEKVFFKSPTYVPYRNYYSEIFAPKHYCKYDVVEYNGKIYLCTDVKNNEIICNSPDINDNNYVWEDMTSVYTTKNLPLKLKYQEQSSVSELNSLYHLEKMKQDNVYDDYITYMDEKTIYDKQQRNLEQDRQLAYKQALKENPNLSYEEFLSIQPTNLNLIEEPQPSKALQAFMDKYL